MHKLKTCHGYPIIVDNENSSFIGLRDRYRGLCLIKNRNGDSQKYISVNFFGEIGMFKELPKPDTITDYMPYVILNYKEEEKIKDVVTQKDNEEFIYDF